MTQRERELRMNYLPLKDLRDGTAQLGLILEGS